MKIGIPREVHAEEKRVAATPESVQQLIKLGYSVAVEAGAGVLAHFTDAAYREAGAEIAADVRTLWAQSDIVLKVRAPELHPALGVNEVDLLRERATLISFIWPAQNPQLLEQLKARNVTVL